MSQSQRQLRGATENRKRLVARSARYVNLSVILAAAVVTQDVRAEALADAVQSAYETNPGLLEKRANQRALDEDYIQARSGWRPTLSAQSVVADDRDDLGRHEGAELLTDATGNLIAVPGGGTYTYNTGNLSVQASQPLYTGGRVRSAVDAAEADVMGGRESLRATEIGIVLSVVQAYADVEQASEVVGVRVDNLSVLGKEVEQVQARIGLGEATKIDLAQARAQQAASQVQLVSARSQLEVTSAAYAALVGHAPDRLVSHTILPRLPTSLDSALEIAERDSPVICQANYNDQAAHYRVLEAHAASHLTATASVSVGYTGVVAPLTLNRFDRALTASVTITQPIYSGGQTSSQVRQASDREQASRLAVEDFRRSVIRDVAQAWSRMEAAGLALSADEVQVQAAGLAFQGLSEQNRFGTATTLDLLLQQQQFRDAELMVFQARHDVLASQAAVLAAIGWLDARSLAPNTHFYDPRLPFSRALRGSTFPTEVIPEATDRVFGRLH